MQDIDVGDWKDYDNFIYFFQVEHRPIFKIGMAKDLDKRIYAMQTNCPDMILYRGAIRCDNRKEALDLERFYHKLFKEFHRHGEWYDMQEKQIFDLLIRYSEIPIRDVVFICPTWASELGEVLGNQIGIHPRYLNDQI